MSKDLLSIDILHTVILSTGKLSTGISFTIIAFTNGLVQDVPLLILVECVSLFCSRVQMMLAERLQTK
jgi:hypothetical protein